MLVFFSVLLLYWLVFHQLGVVQANDFGVKIGANLVGMSLHTLNSLCTHLSFFMFWLNFFIVRIFSSIKFVLLIKKIYVMNLSSYVIMLTVIIVAG